MDIPKLFVNMKNVMLAMLALMAVFALATGGLSNAAHLAVTVVTAVALDSAIYVFVKKQPLKFPDSALITGLIIGLVMSSVSLPFSALTAAIAVASKHVLRYNGRHVFNPGNFAILLATFLYPAQAFQTWWASANVYVTAGLGLVNVWKVNRWSMMAAFLVPYVLFSLLLRPQPLANILGGTLFFFAFFMFIEPFTAPLFSEKARVIFGLLVAFFALVVDFGPLLGIPETTKYGFPLALVLADLFVPFLNKRYPVQQKMPQTPTPSNPPVASALASTAKVAAKGRK